MAVGWTWAFDTPFKWTKQIASHFGGTRQGMAISWPKAHQGQGRHPQPVPPRHRHRADDPRGHRHPGARDRSTASSRSPIEGVSMAYTFDKANANAPSPHKTQYFEMMGDRAIYHDGWIASTKVMRAAVGHRRRARSTRPEQVPVGAVRPDATTGRRPRTSRPRIRTRSRKCRRAVLAGGQEVPGAAAGRPVATRMVTPRPSITAGRNVFT